MGQDEAVRAVADAVRLSRAGLREGDKPVATFLFLGPTGVGKTELAKALAESIYGDEGALLRIDMSEYGERHAVARLVGAPPGYVGYDEGGQLTEKVRRKPYSVLLLDEIEKAHPDVYNILLQVFDDGRLTDGKGRVVDFTNTIIIATSNLGSDIIQRRLKAGGAAGEEYEKTKSEVMDVLRGHFRPEFINRIDEIIVFHALGKEEIRHIVGLQLDRVARNAASQGVTLTFDQTLIDHFAEEGYKPEFGARELKRLIRSELETALAREMLGGGIGKGDHANARWDDKPNGWSSSARSHPRSRLSLKSPMPRTWPRHRLATRASLRASLRARRSQRTANLERWEAVVSDPNGLTWAATLVSLAVAIPTAGHAVIYKRDPRSATLWVLLIALLPLGGSLLYGLFGINRYQRRARRLFPGADPAVRQDLSPTIPEAVSPPLAGLAHLVGRATGQSLTGGNRIEPLVDGEQAYPAMLAAIESARYSVALTSYIFDSQGIGAQFVDALRRAHERGVQVRVLIDDVYARWTPRSAYRALQRAGVPAATFNPTLIPARLHAAHLRNHRKLLVIDGETGFTGGLNIFSPYWRPDAPDQACHDLHFRLRGPVIAHLMRCFTDDWCDTTGERLSKGYWGEPPVTADEQGTSWARGIEAGPDEALDRMRWTFMGALSAAKHSVRIWTPYFVPDQPMIAALSTAALRGVRVEVLTPANGDHPTVQWAARAHYWQVLEHGVRIFERPGPFDHSKLMLIDGQWCCLGSANWDARSLRLNFEFNVEVYDTALSTRLSSLFDAARDASGEISAKALRARPLAIRLRDGVARLFTPIL